MDFKSEIVKAIAAFEKAFNTRDTATMASYYAEDATLLPPGSPMIKGRSNIQAYWQSFINAGGSDAKLKVVEVGTSGDMAYEIGAFDAILPAPQGGAARAQGKYLVVWKTQTDGTIKMLADIFNVNS